MAKAGLGSRQEPRKGGLIICNAKSPELKTILQEDPFDREQIAEYEVIDFLPSMTAPQFAEFNIRKLLALTMANCERFRRPPPMSPEKIKTERLDKPTSI
jgi:hypothetical protein